MAIEDYTGDDDGEDSPVATLGALTSAMNTTTPEAQEYARHILDARMASKGDPNEAGIINQLESKAEQNRQTLRAARERLSKQEYPQGLAWLRASAALGAPTKTGAFSESVGHLASSLVPYVEERHKFNQERDKELLSYDTAINGSDSDILAAKLSLLKSRIASGDRMAVEALKTLGRQSKVGQPGKGMSNYGKIANDEGHLPGTPEFNRRVAQLRNEDLKVKQTTAGMDGAPPTPDERAALANQYGLPVLPTDPYAGLSTKMKAQAQSIDQRQADTKLKDLDDQSKAAREAIRDADRFLSLNKDVPSGKLQGLLPALSAKAQEMEGITARLSRQMRVPGEGATSDFDAQQFLKGTFNRRNLPAANENLAAGFKASKQNTVDMQDFLQNYYALNGTLRGAQPFWNQYLNDNPIFDPTAPGSYKLNDHRMNYKDYFRTKHLGERQQEPVKKAEGGAIRSAAQGASLGFEDELEGAFSNDPNATKHARASVLKDQEENPISSGVAQASGAALLLKGLQVAKRMGMSNAALKFVPRSELIRLAITGGLTGMAAGVGSGEDGERGETGFSGAILGSTAGPLAGLAAKYGLVGLGNAVARRPTAKDPFTRADMRVNDALERDRGVDVGQRMAEGQKLRVPSTFGTSGGENLQALGKASIAEGADEADQFATDAAKRMMGSRGRVEERVNQSLKPDEYFGKMDELTNDLYENAKPLYKKAYDAHPSIQSKELLDILQTDAGEKAVKEAMGFFNNIPGKKIGPEDAMKMVQNPSLEFFDKVKQGFDQLIAKEENQGPTPVGKTMRMLRNKLVDTLDDQAPEYKTARSQYKGDLEVRDALRAGREDFHKSTPEEIRRLMNGTPAIGTKPAGTGMSFTEKDAYRSGVAQRLFEEINKPAGKDFNAANKVIGSPATAEKLEALFDKPSDFKLFKTALDRELEEYGKSKDLASSAGSARLARASNDPSMVGKMSNVLESLPYKTSMLGNVWNLMRMRPDMSEETAEQVAKILKESDPKIAKDYLSRLSTKAASLARRKKRAGKVGMATAAITGAMTAPSPHYSNVEDSAETP